MTDALHKENSIFLKVGCLYRLKHDLIFRDSLERLARAFWVDKETILLFTGAIKKTNQDKLVFPVRGQENEPYFGEFIKSNEIIYFKYISRDEEECEVSSSIFDLYSDLNL